MIQLLASTRSKEYPIFLDSGASESVGKLWKSIGRSGKVVIVTDSNVAGLYLEGISASLASEGFSIAEVVLEPGEGAKSLEQASRLYSRLFELQVRRRDAVLALGGGVVGDLAGFVASTYMRGIGLMQVPTTLLSQVDSSIGGKVGVNISEAKNYVGSFYQPDMVVADPGLLKSLPERQLQEGLAEVVKYALLTGEDFFSALESSSGEFLDLNMSFVEPVVRRCIEYKLRVVSEDERDYGRRAVLNLGHTVGHGIEAAGDYGVYSHGQAVALGLIAAVGLSQRLMGLPGEYGERLGELLGDIGLPVRMQGIDPEAVLASMASDKKADDLSANMVLLKALGEPQINCDVEGELVRAEVERLVG
ncbi:MAG: 3-dehydroquinate synthase [Gaiellales bacterium]|nr:MAG: 3-dehydroquinate synthase [Gaiellales bacterium]